MFVFRTGLAALAVVLSTGLAWAAPLELTPADPQPSGLKSGLSVRYSYPIDVKTLSIADQVLAQTAETGRPISGLTYPDKGEGVNVMTSKQPTLVAAGISGYIRFDSAGVYTLEFFANDGLRVDIGGQRVANHDERTPCNTTGAVQVSVPQPGWYPLSATYFQRFSTACLEMEWAPPGGGQVAVPNAAFGH